LRDVHGLGRAAQRGGVARDDEADARSPALRVLLAAVVEAPPAHVPDAVVVDVVRPLRRGRGVVVEEADRVRGVVDRVVVDARAVEAKRDRLTVRDVREVVAGDRGRRALRVDAVLRPADTRVPAGVGDGRAGDGDV